ncbi:hypothetical protein Tcan_05891 [Toxocara canis]|uniref:UPAR/Ly6 domain-containing protein n=1 Tax=Toxocara canis TaxID=6265 RepID=A0A0B2VCA9_TOXCA|nr:hypothetical protein Tcan_05891 [Toxocara canis]
MKKTPLLHLVLLSLCLVACESLQCWYGATVIGATGSRGGYVFKQCPLTASGCVQVSSDTYPNGSNRGLLKLDSRGCGGDILQEVDKTFNCLVEACDKRSFQAVSKTYMADVCCCKSHICNASPTNNSPLLQALLTLSPFILSLFLF